MSHVLLITEPELLVLETADGTVLVEVARQGPPGRAGVDGANGADGAAGIDGAARLSTDPGNRSILGSDQGIYTPDFVADPLAYYILAKA